MKVIKKDMKSVCFEFKDPKTSSAESCLKFDKTSTDGVFNLIVQVDETSCADKIAIDNIVLDKITINLGTISIEEVEEIANILKTMSGLKKNTDSQLITD